MVIFLLILPDELKLVGRIDNPTLTCLSRNL